MVRVYVLIRSLKTGSPQAGYENIVLVGADAQSKGCLSLSGAPSDRRPGNAPVALRRVT